LRTIHGPTLRAEKRTAQLSAHPNSPLAGAGNNACYNGILQWWKKRRIDCNKVREYVVRLIYLYLGKHEFFRHFTVKKTRLPLLAKRLCCLYI